MASDERFQRLEVELKQAVRLHVRLRSSRRPKERALAEYNLGVPSPLEEWFGLTREQRYLGRGG